MSERDKWQLAVWAAVAAVVAVLVVRAWSGSAEEPVASSRPPPVRIESDRKARGSGGPTIYVHVGGAVRRPGLVRVPGGSRVAAAVARAGGPTRAGDVDAVNLAQKLEDGQQVLVPDRSAAGAAGSAAGSAEAEAPVSLASASVEELDGLDGIGPTLAQRIVDYRTEHGGFRSVDELQEIDGIGEKRLESLSEAVTP